MRIQGTPSDTLTGHSEPINQAVFLPNNHLASCSEDEAIKVWDTASGEELFTLKGHTGVVYSLAILLNGWLASSSEDKKIKIWNLQEEREVENAAKDTKEISFRWKCSRTETWSAIPWTTPSRYGTRISPRTTSWWPSLGMETRQGLCFSKSSQTTVWLHSHVTKTIWKRPHSEFGIQMTDNWSKHFQLGSRLCGQYSPLSNGQTAIGAANGTIKIIDLDDVSKTRTKEKAYKRTVSSLLQLSNGNLVSAGADRESSRFIFSIKVWDILGLTLLQHV